MRARSLGEWADRAVVLGMLAVALLAFPLAASASSPRAPGARLEALPRSLGARAAAPSPRGTRKALLAARARAAAEGGVSLTPSKTKPYWLCPEGPCDAIIDPEPVRKKVHAAMRLALPDGRPLEGDGELGGFDAQNLQSAYDIPINGGAAGETIAIDDAYGYSNAEQDLAVYRERYGLPPCTHANGCFRKVNQKGQEGNYPAEGGWDGEQALDIDMVSAACPECHILLVQADTATERALGEAEDTAVRLGAIEVSNSWSSPEQDCGIQECEKYEREYFEHPGVMLFFAGGDNGYDNVFEGAHSPDYPASLPSTIAVGGTALYRADNARGWTEETWYEPSIQAGGGSGCSRFPKPAWQGDPGCNGRMTVDVAADAACETPVSSYENGKWRDVCGTSAASPLVAGIEAHAEEAVRELPGAEAFYEAVGGLDEVTKGINGKCSDAPGVAYFCRAGVGYNGPTGNGSPEGPLILGTAAPRAVTDPPSGVSSGQATLAGYVSPLGLDTTYWFEYGTTTAYGARAPVPEGSVGTSGRQVTETIAELQSDAIYHYRLVASNADGTSYGADYAFSNGTPTITGVSPATGPGDGGETVKITGSNLLAATAVDFGSTEASEFTVESNTSISAPVPQGTGAVQVSVTTPAGTSPPSGEARFVYDPPGPVLAWGENGGDLGDGELASSDVPVEVSGLGEAQALSSGWGQSLALLAGGKPMAWGENEFGVVGDGTYEPRTRPVRVCAEGVAECADGPYLEEVTAVSAGRLPSLALLANGTVAAWGGNLYGDLATDTERNPYPLPVCTKLESPCQPENYLREVVEIAAGADFSLARLKNGTVMAWGENAQGELGIGTTSGPETCGAEKEACSRVPVPVAGLGEVAAIAAGSLDGFALLKNGTVMAWGGNEVGQLGDGAASARSSVPELVCAIGEAKAPCKHDLDEVQSVSGGLYDSYALLKNGTVASSGYNEAGQLGDGSEKGPKTCKVEKAKVACATTPVHVEGLSGVRALAQGEFAPGGLVQLEDGELETWGRGGAGELGDGRSSQSDKPVGVCAAFASGPCPEGPFLHGQVTAFASGFHDVLAMPPSSGPIFSSLKPDAGPAAGGTRVTILGGNLEGATAVDFGGAPATEFEVRSADEIVAVAPPGSGVVAVTVSTPEGTSSTESEDEFTYEGVPAVVTGEATGIHYGEATLNATVDPNAEAVGECRFEYGTTPAYGESVPCSSLPGAGTRPVAVSAALSGLEATTTYYYRAFATNAAGASYGSQRTFTTAQLPEVGRCLKLGGKAKTGAYSSSSCTTRSAGGDSGSYEWRPWPLADESFALSGGKAALTGRNGNTLLECAASHGSGEYTGPQTATMSLTLTSCMSATQKIACNSQGLAAGEMSIASAHAELGLIDAAKPSVGWAINQSSSAVLASLECPAQGFQPTLITLRGAAIAPLKTVDEMTTSDAFDFADKGDAQIPERFEGGPEDALTLEIPAPLAQRAALATSVSLSSGEPVEFRGRE